VARKKPPAFAEVERLKSVKGDAPIAANHSKAQAPKRRPLTFKQCDLTRAIRAAVVAGMRVDRAWIECDGTIVLGFARADGAEPREPKEIIL
jgi:hypothetical protein